MFDEPSQTVFKIALKSWMFPASPPQGLGCRRIASHPHFSPCSIKVYGARLPILWTIDRVAAKATTTRLSEGHPRGSSDGSLALSDLEAMHANRSASLSAATDSALLPAVDPEPADCRVPVSPGYLSRPPAAG